MKLSIDLRVLALAATLAAPVTAPQAAVTPLPFKVPAVVADKQDAQTPDAVQLTGWIGSRITANESNRLAKIDVDRLLEGYRKRPGRQTWDGEHIGKWLHAATLAWVNSNDPALRKKLDLAVTELCKCQLPDGYLGTYLEKDRWTHWDVWAHKYNTLGLITYMRYTGNLEPLPTCRRMADLLCKTFGDGTNQLDIVPAGHHKGLASTSVLEPMVLLYRMTGEPRYLDFCKYILRAWEQPNGPKIVSTLLSEKRVDKVGNGKAYEMLSCLNGALELYRVTGETNLFNACLIAWDDIVRNRLYPTGAASYGEFFHDDFDFPSVANVGETCVTVTWLQFNAQLLRLTGESRFAEQLERVILNQLFGAQRCDGSGWGYYVQMAGRKPYSSTLDGHCCLSSGPRGVALIPSFAVTTDADGLVLNLYDQGKANLKLQDGTPLTVTTTTRYPSDARIHITLDPAETKAFAVKVRIPAWCKNSSVWVNSRMIATNPAPDRYIGLRNTWKKGDRLELRFKLRPQVIVGDHRNDGKVAVQYGPLVLAADQALLGLTNATLSCIAAASTNVAVLDVKPFPAPKELRSWPGALVYRIHGKARKPVGDLPAGAPLDVTLVPFADAGAYGSTYQVWLPVGLASKTGNVLLDGHETHSRMGKLEGSMIDEDFQTYVTSLPDRAGVKDWFMVMLDDPTPISRIVFAHGQTFPNGGWYDASEEKPKVQIKRTADAQWETVGELKNYPPTTASNAAGLKGGERFEVELASPAPVLGVRVIGKPSGGKNANRAFSSCAELQAFAPTK